eukprot:TRINITY_DN488_c0_g1_i1.p1 TRINITY_DN488_c0_g1~~TRINITY_DN488_c0_g1_i1.p1  ORF type:complete len:202 (-),score=54.62 TRINITY_DN488_c0_g1_i1:47-652(-)
MRPFIVIVLIATAIGANAMNQRSEECLRSAKKFSSTAQQSIEAFKTLNLDRLYALLIPIVSTTQNFMIDCSGPKSAFAISNVGEESRCLLASSELAPLIRKVVAESKEKSPALRTTISNVVFHVQNVLAECGASIGRDFNFRFKSSKECVEDFNQVNTDVQRIVGDIVQRGELYELTEVDFYPRAVDRTLNILAICNAFRR